MLWRDLDCAPHPGQKVGCRLSTVTVHARSRRSTPTTFKPAAGDHVIDVFITPCCRIRSQGASRPAHHRERRTRRRLHQESIRPSQDGSRHCESKIMPSSAIANRRLWSAPTVRSTGCAGPFRFRGVLRRAARDVREWPMAYRSAPCSARRETPVPYGHTGPRDRISNRDGPRRNSRFHASCRWRRPRAHRHGSIRARGLSHRVRRAVQLWSDDRRLYDGAISAPAGSERLVLWSQVPLYGEDLKTVGEFTLEDGQSVAFVLSYGTSFLGPPSAIDPFESLHLQDMPGLSPRRRG